MYVFCRMKWGNPTAAGGGRNSSPTGSYFWWGQRIVGALNWVGTVDMTAIKTRKTCSIVRNAGRVKRHYCTTLCYRFWYRND